MRCHKAQEFISLSLDDAIGEYDRSQLVQHLEGCNECADYQAVLQRGTELLRPAPMSQPSENFEWNVQLGIQKALRDGVRSEIVSERQRGLWLSAGLSAAAAALVVVGLGWVALQSGILTLPAGGRQPTSANARPGAQIVDNLAELNTTPNLGNAIPGPGYRSGRLDRGNVTPVSGTRGRVIPGVDELVDPNLSLLSIDDYLALQRENQMLRMQNRQQAQLILSLQSHANAAHISDVGDSGAAAEPR
ncbi:MAG TPA: zf-HC2 domain-containing protein [Candidatus Krumholzibacteria bacterium]